MDKTMEEYQNEAKINLNGIALVAVNLWCIKRHGGDWVTITAMHDFKRKDIMKWFGSSIEDAIELNCTGIHIGVS